MEKHARFKDDLDVEDDNRSSVGSSHAAPEDDINLDEVRKSNFKRFYKSLHGVLLHNVAASKSNNFLHSHNSHGCFAMLVEKSIIHARHEAKIHVPW